MNTSQATWQDWIQTIHSRGFASITASLLEAVTPLAIIGAQMIYISEPVLSPLFSPLKIHALANLLENQEDYQKFIYSLKEVG